MRFPTVQVDAHTVVVLEPRLIQVQRKFIYLWAELHQEPERIGAVIDGLDAFVMSRITEAAERGLEHSARY